MKLTAASRALLCLMAITALLGSVASVSPSGERVRSVAAQPNPVLTGGGGVRNSTLYYDGTTVLRPGSDMSALGRPGLVVTTATSDEAGTVAAIHSLGAKAFRYVQFYWAPDDAAYEGINLNQHPEWAFCGRDNRKVLGRTTNSGARKWYFIDANETAVRAELQTILARFKSEGWDGVMFDRGAAATTYAADAEGSPTWYKRSTCTSDPYERGARFADAYVTMLGLAHSEGLLAMMNSGKSPFDPEVRMRPNPDSRSCRARHWSSCRFLNDVWPHLDLALNEAATRPRDIWWHRTFVGNQRSEQSRTHAQRTVDLVTTSSLGGASHQTRPNVFYAWSRIRLFNLSAAVNTGDGGCGAAADSSVCNQYGSYPELVDVNFGSPLGGEPGKRGCLSSSHVHCVWTRRYESGVNMINVSNRSRRGALVKTGLSSCRFVYDVYKREPAAGNRCVTSFYLAMPVWSGRPFAYSTSPW